MPKHRNYGSGISGKASQGEHSNGNHLPKYGNPTYMQSCVQK